MAENPTDSAAVAPLIADPAVRAASPGTGKAPEGGCAVLVPELSVSDIRESLSFWCGVLGFEIAFDRPAARFAFLARERLQVMLCERNGRWEPAEMRRPFGRGVNFQLTVERVAPILASLESAGWPLYEQPRDAWYRVGDHEQGSGNSSCRIRTAMCCGLPKIGDNVRRQALDRRRQSTSDDDRSERGRLT